MNQMSSAPKANTLPPRVGRLKAGMEKQGVDVIVSFKPENSFYFTGFNPIIYSHPVIAILTRDHDPIMLVHALRDDHGRASAWVPDIRLYGTWSTKVTMGPNWQNALATILGDLGLAGKTVGIEEEFVSIQRLNQLRGVLPEAKFADVSHLIDHCRLIKDPDEIAHARIAASVADIGMNTAIEALKAGGNEREICIASMHAMNKTWTADYPDVEVCDFGSLEGGVQNGMCTWALSGPRMFYNCDNPTQRKPQQGEPISLLIWTIANGIHAENERTVAVGTLPDVNRRAIEAILEIRAEVDEIIKPGTAYRDLFEKTREGLTKRGYGANIPGRIGHGIGLGAHEHSSLDAASTLVLEPGMLFTFEPNIRVPGVCATQISDTVLITENGREYLTQSAGGYLEV